MLESSVRMEKRFLCCCIEEMTVFSLFSLKEAFYPPRIREKRMREIMQESDAASRAPRRLSAYRLASRRSAERARRIFCMARLGLAPSTGRQTPCPRPPLLAQPRQRSPPTPLLLLEPFLLSLFTVFHRPSPPSPPPSLHTQVTPPQAPPTRASRAILSSPPRSPDR